MRYITLSARIALPFLVIAAALAACSATASDAAIPGASPGYYADPAYVGEAPLYGDFGLGFGWDGDGGNDHRAFHRDHGHAFAHFGGHGADHAFGHGGFGHAGFGHGGFGHGGGHGR
jgi:hypothetical protein